MATAAETTEARTDAKDDSTKKDDVKPSVREFVAQDREGKRAAADSAKEEAESKKEAATTEDEDKSDKGDAEKKPYTNEELTRELESKDISELDQSRLPAELKKKLDIITTAEGKKHHKLNQQLKALEAKQKELEDAIAAAKAGKTDKPTETDTEDDTESLITKEELTAFYKSKAGKAMLAETLEELGFNRIDAKEAADTRLFRDAISGAKAEDDRLQDETFFDEVLEHIKNDEKLSATTRKETVTGVEIRSVFLTAANAVDKARIAKERESLKAEQEKLEKVKKETKNRTQPASKAAGSRQAAAPSGERPSYREYVKQHRAGRT